MRLTRIAPALVLIFSAGFTHGALGQSNDGFEQSYLPPPSGFGAPTAPTPSAQSHTFQPGQTFDASPDDGQPGTGMAPPAGDEVGTVAPAGAAIVMPEGGGDVTVIQPPSVRIPNRVAVYAGLDKITGRITSFDVPLGETAQFGALQVTPRACYTRPPTETQNITSFSEVNEVTLKGEAKRIFTGWMFASSPGLHAVEHPIYDVWLIGCKAPAPVTAEGQQ
ncbi:DUF2155 domain-containing protein [Xanthobacter sp. TB0136]|uniref:DUF2155 domain-containing protein n=1 Tax=Xanthobacter sp. TB0136 TaxID=3459177 RepID=UPI0040399FEF